MSDIIFEAVCATLDELNSCVILLSSDARVLYANRAGGEMLEAGWPVRQVKGYLQGRDRLTTASILSGLESIVRNRLSSLAKVRLNICLAPPANGANTVLGAMAALPGGEITSAKSAVASFFITQASERLEWSAAGLSEGYNLTPAETRTLEQITKGGTLLETALALDVSENTVKTHLQNIFSKTGTSRQTELMRLVAELQLPIRSIPKTSREKQRRAHEYRRGGSHSAIEAVQL